MAAAHRRKQRQQRNSERLRIKQQRCQKTIRIGIGRKLLREIAKAALEKGCAQMRLGVLDWNRPAVDFYSRRGAVDLTAAEGWHAFRFEAEALKRLALGEEDTGARPPGSSRT